MGEVLEKKYSIAEYLAFEIRAASKYEFYNGNIVEMPGGTISHNLISANLITGINIALDKNQHEYLVLTSDMKIYVPGFNHFVYPDCVVVVEKPVHYENRKDVLLNPLLVVEVMSPSSEIYDRGEKFYKYRTLPSLKEYVLVSQDQIWVSSFYKQGTNTWTELVSENRESNIVFSSIGCEIPLSRIYKGVEF